MATFIKVSSAEAELLRRNRDQVQGNRLQKVEGDEQRHTAAEIRKVQTAKPEEPSTRRLGRLQREEPAASFISTKLGKLITRFTLADGEDFMHYLRITVPYVSEVCGYGWGHPIIDPADFGNPPEFLGGYDPGDFGYPDPEINDRPAELRYVSQAYYPPIEPYEPWYAQGRTDLDLAALRLAYPAAQQVTVELWGGWFTTGIVGTEPITVDLELMSSSGTPVSTQQFSQVVSSVFGDVPSEWPSSTSPWGPGDIPPVPFNEIVTNYNSPVKVTLMKTVTISLQTGRLTLT
jgi:hypothetical protein